MPTENTGMIPFTSTEVDSAAREKQAKADLKAERATKKAQLAEAEAAIMDEQAESEAAAYMMPDVQPNFATMDEDGVRKFMRVFTAWLRHRGAVVRGPEVTSHEVSDTSTVEQTREGSATPEENRKKETMTVYEGFFEWEYKGADMPVTIRRVHVTDIEALRDTALEAYTRRNEA